ncbi:MAG: hypothetical protein P8177_06155, partial [Gemmatimonadota bacterium]
MLFEVAVPADQVDGGAHGPDRVEVFHVARRAGEALVDRVQVPAYGPLVQDREVVVALAAFQTGDLGLRLRHVVVAAHAADLQPGQRRVRDGHALAREPRVIRLLVAEPALLRRRALHLADVTEGAGVGRRHQRRNAGVVGV